MAKRKGSSSPIESKSKAWAERIKAEAGEDGCAPAEDGEGKPIPVVALPVSARELIETIRRSADWEAMRTGFACSVFSAMISCSSNSEEYCYLPSLRSKDFVEDEAGTNVYYPKTDHWGTYPIGSPLPSDCDGKRYRNLKRPYQQRLAEEAVEYAEALINALGYTNPSSQETKGDGRQD